MISTNANIISALVLNLYIRLKYYAEIIVHKASKILPTISNLNIDIRVFSSITKNCVIHAYMYVQI